MVWQHRWSVCCKPSKCHLTEQEGLPPFLARPASMSLLFVRLKSSKRC
uniref:Uncharacterized protein n=1 Tax=Rhizophora mucronata TaxID=61149 RepID=A0A2P2IUM0_RHIMU